MKIAVLLGDGMADVPLDELDGLTPLQSAATPHLDALAREGVLGTAVTVPEGYPAGSDVANLSVFGYDPAVCYSGRAPLEAAAMGVDLGPGDVAYRMNLVHLLAGMKEVYMDDFTAGHIGSAEARQIVETLAAELRVDGFEFYPGVSYRHLLVWRGGEDRAVTTPPHDILGQPIQEHLPRGPGAEELTHLVTGSQMLLMDHPVNRARQEAGHKTANSIWLWGQGRKPQMHTYREKYGLTGAVVSAVDLLKGIARVAGLDAPEVPGATGYLDTNYAGKVAAALDALADGEFVYLHVEAPDEAGHSGSAADKVRAIADFDAQVVGPVRAALEARGEAFAILAMPDHPTPVPIRTHNSDAVPFALYASAAPGGSGAAGFCEDAARATGVHVPHAHQLMDHILGRGRAW
ncbi:MAG: cofactor-independent phosphoglycerate mutase [Deferrisomatales bacterium]|nr:cofactor-independent phosphoglycerate mutase [Deferrisomatales bacterium]